MRGSVEMVDQQRVPELRIQGASGKRGLSKFAREDIKISVRRLGDFFKFQ
jgi:hypothetical protein